jgi:hypothetical protein
MEVALIKDLINKFKSIPYHYWILFIGIILTVLLLVTAK